MTIESGQEEPLREVLAEAEGLRVQLVSVGPSQQVRWHAHTAVSDTIVAVVGSVIVETAAPPARHRLEPGDRVTIPAGTAHTVSGDDRAACRFLNIHSGGAYDFRPAPDVG
jgi:quercetin dioxygenase-like cupin family protein